MSFLTRQCHRRRHDRAGQRREHEGRGTQGGCQPHRCSRPIATGHIEGDARKGSASSGVAWFMYSCSGDTMQPCPLHESEGQAVDFSTDSHLTPPPGASENRVVGVNGGVGVIDHHVNLILDYCPLDGGVQFVAICNDVGELTPPRKPHEETYRTKGMHRMKQKWDTSCMSALLGGSQWQALLRSHGNHDDIA